MIFCGKNICAGRGYPSSISRRSFLDNAGQVGLAADFSERFSTQRRLVHIMKLGRACTQTSDGRVLPDRDAIFILGRNDYESVSLWLSLRKTELRLQPKYGLRL